MEPMIKGYAVRYVANHILDTPELASRVDEPTHRLARELGKRTEASDWVPRRDMITLLRGIAAACDSDEKARRAIVDAGRAVGDQATNTFLRLLMKMLTPRMFAAKLPDLFKRDHQGGGRIEIHRLEERAIHLQIRDIAGFDHMGPLSEGWFGSALSAMGLVLTTVSATPWSRDEPGPERVDFRAEWQ